LLLSLSYLEVPTMPSASNFHFAVIPAWIAGIQSQGCETLDWQSIWIKHFASGKLPSMALDSGIHAGMTVFRPK
jgi:hypothetical protein